MFPTHYKATSRVVELDLARKAADFVIMWGTISDLEFREETETDFDTHNNYPIDNW